MKVKKFLKDGKFSIKERRETNLTKLLKNFVIFHQEDDPLNFRNIFVIFAQEDIF